MDPYDEHIYAYCPVPDTTDLPVGNVKSYLVSGYNSGSNGGDEMRGCIQFDNGSGQACDTWYYPPTGYYTDWSLHIYTNWTQWWHTAYVEIVLRTNSELNRVMVKDS